MPDQESDARLRAGVGVIPKELRNKGYERKLDIKPGEGGIHATSAGHEDNLKAIRDLGAAIRGMGASKGRQAR